MGGLDVRKLKGRRHARLLCELMAMPDIRCEEWGMPAISREIMHIWMDKLAENAATSGEPRGMWGAFSNDGRLVAFVVLGTSPIGRTAYIGYATHPEFRRRGICTRLAAHVLVEAGRTAPEMRVAAFCDPGNAGSAEVSRRLGLAPSGLHRLPGGTREVSGCTRVLQAHMPALEALRVSRGRKSSPASTTAIVILAAGVTLAPGSVARMPPVDISRVEVSREEVRPPQADDIPAHMAASGREGRGCSI